MSVSGNGPDFHLPDEILAVIPTDPYDQLDLARKITSMAIASRVSKLDLEAGRLKQMVAEKDKLIDELQERVDELERMIQENDARLHAVLDENAKLTNERDALVVATKKLNRDLAKLESFKRQLMQSLSDESLSNETVDIGTCEPSVSKSSSGLSLKEVEANGYSSSNHIQSSSLDATRAVQDASMTGGNKFSMTPYFTTPRLTPTGTPKITSSAVSPRSSSAVVSPKRTSSATSPVKSHYDGRSALSTWYPPSQQSSAASSPPHGRSLPGRAPRLDGKEFFRQARSRLLYEQFSAFLANVKDLNAHKQSREETLRKAEEIFGPENKDLYLSFQGLLNRSVH